MDVNVAAVELVLLPESLLGRRGEDVETFEAVGEDGHGGLVGDHEVVAGLEELQGGELGVEDELEISRCRVVNSPEMGRVRVMSAV